MKPELFSIGPVTIYGYGLMVALGIWGAISLAERRAPGQGLDGQAIFTMALWAVAGGFAGSKLLYCIVELPNILRDPSILLNLGNGWVVYGAILGGIFTLWVYCRVKKLSFLAYADLIMPSLALGQAVGRIGCLLAGCCYGRETSSWFHIVFTESHIAPNGVPLIPTQLISSAANFAHLALLLWVARRFRRPGVVTGAYLVCYSLGRAFIETLRSDARGAVGVLSTSQFISLFTAVAGALLVFWAMRRAPSQAETPQS